MSDILDSLMALTPSWQLIDNKIVNCYIDVFFVSEYQSFPAKGGVYVIYCDCCCDHPLYVGKTTNLRERFRTGHQVTPHLIPHENVVLEFHYIEDATLAGFIERQWIGNGKPTYNREHQAP